MYDKIYQFISIISDSVSAECVTIIACLCCLDAKTYVIFCLSLSFNPTVVNNNDYVPIGDRGTDYHCCQ